MNYKFKDLLRASLLFFLITPFLVSCGDDEETESEELGTATIKGQVEAQLNDTNTTTYEEAPSGTSIQAWISTEDLVTRPDASKKYEKRYFEGSVDGNGEYELSVDAHKEPVTVTVEPMDFEAEYIDAAGEEARGVYKYQPATGGSSFTVEVIRGQTKIEDIQYTRQ